MASTIKFLDLLKPYDLRPNFNSPTRITESSQTCIDNIFSDSRTTPQQTKLYDPFISDHRAQLITLKLKEGSNKNDYVMVERNDFCQANIRNLKLMLNREDWREVTQESDLNKAYDNFIGILKHHIDTTCPIKVMLRSGTIIYPFPNAIPYLYIPRPLCTVPLLY